MADKGVVRKKDRTGPRSFADMTDEQLRLFLDELYERSRKPRRARRVRAGSHRGASDGR